MFKIYFLPITDIIKWLGTYKKESFFVLKIVRKNISKIIKKVQTLLLEDVCTSDRQINLGYKLKQTIHKYNFKSIWYMFVRASLYKRRK